MPWCPKCKSEYREGFTVCVDCGCQLVDEEQAAALIPLTFGEREQMEALEEFLIYSGIQNVELVPDEADGQTQLQVSREEFEKAAAAVRMFLIQEQGRMSESGEAEKGREDDDKEETAGFGVQIADERLREASIARRTFRGSSFYEDSSQRAIENLSSAWILLIVGILGLILVVLGVMEVIPLRLGNPYLFYGVMIAVFLLFVVAGAMSMKSAKLFARKAESENSLRSTMLDWCRENLKADEIDQEVSADSTPEEVLYFSRTFYIKEKLNHQFVNLDQDFLDRFVDDHVYGMVFEGEKE